MKTTDPDRTLDRRSLLLAGAGLGAAGWVGAQTNRDTKAASPKGAAKPKPVAKPKTKAMTSEEEAEVARAVAENIAEETGEPAHPAVGTILKIPNRFKLFDGREFAESQTQGKLLLIYYWATWCPICKLVSPRLQTFWRQNQHKGVEVLALSVDAKAQNAFAYTQQRGYKFPSSMAVAAQFGEIMAPRSLPTLMVRSKLGVIVSVDEGDIDAEEFNDFLVHL